MKLNVLTENWPLKKPFVIARESIENVDVILVEIKDGQFVGRGEGVPQLIYDQTTNSCKKQIDAIKPNIETGTTRSELMNLLPPGSARNAVDCALWDLEAKKTGRSVWSLLDIAEPRSAISGDMTIGLETIEGTISAARNASSFDLVKLKLNEELVMERVAAVRIGAPKSGIMVDVNEAWSLDELKFYAPLLKVAGVVLIEQPLPRGRDWGLIDYDCPIPLAADESCFDRMDLDYLTGRYQYVNIKLDKTGGLTEALALCREARCRGFGLMAGCMVSTSLSMAPGFVLASQCEYRDLDGATGLVDDRTHPMKVEAGLIHPFLTTLWG